MWSEGAVSIKNSVFTSNAACNGNTLANCEGGGAVASDGAALTISDSYFTNNSAGNPQYARDGFGGAISYHNPDHTGNVLVQVTIERCAFRDNAATAGGAVSFSIANTTLSECSFYANTAYLAGAIKVYQGQLAVALCDFVNNTASWGSGGGGAIFTRERPFS
jgi:hypothetical protein